MSIRLQQITFTGELWDGAGVAKALWDVMLQKDRLVDISSGDPPYKIVLGVPHHGAPGEDTIAEEWINPKTGQPGRTADDSAGLFGLALFTVLREAGIPTRLLIACHPTDHDPNKTPGPYWEQVYKDLLPGNLLMELHGAAKHRKHDLELSAGHCAGARPDHFGKALAHFLRGAWILAVQKQPGSSEAYLFRSSDHASGRLQNPALETPILKAAGELGLTALHLEMKEVFRRPDRAYPTAPTPPPDAWQLARAIKDAFMALTPPEPVQISTAELGLPGTASLVRPSSAYEQSFLRATAEVEADFDLLPDLRVFTPIQFQAFVSSCQRPFFDGPPGEPPEDILWLVDQGEFIGRVFFFHWLNEEHRQSDGQIDYWIRPSRRGQGYGRLILPLALERFRQLGQDRVLISVLSDNTASRRIIEACGGEFDGEALEGTVTRRRYWIKL